MVVSVKGKDGKTRDYSAGVGDRETGEEPPKNAHVRVGSNTKTFTAVAVLQPVGEGKVKLDEPIDTYLPGAIVKKTDDMEAMTEEFMKKHETVMNVVETAICE
ncbi:serine hydrolase [Actinomadura algeriensis]|uniref:CubicO group peptidase (Beta-lactamase class C family) n=1 Tax=Actinomadura algeriensis TaxID=1679523 RepID=A0ABR9JTD8_9ACTN|nr:serine hydrolase domain-containing protein [Actinomadura algeriensis]MBE1533837.1 CubicO group peptidase (beta-lactamase class C family) [Actinomadura algeriensis]